MISEHMIQGKVTLFAIHLGRLLYSAIPPSKPMFDWLSLQPPIMKHYIYSLKSTQKKTYFLQLGPWVIGEWLPQPGFFLHPIFPWKMSSYARSLPRPSCQNFRLRSFSWRAKCFWRLEASSNTESFTGGPTWESVLWSWWSPQSVVA